MDWWSPPSTHTRTHAHIQTHMQAYERDHATAPTRAHTPTAMASLSCLAATSAPCLAASAANASPLCASASAEWTGFFIASCAGRCEGDLPSLSAPSYMTTAPRMSCTVRCRSPQDTNRRTSSGLSSIAWGSQTRTHGHAHTRTGHTHTGGSRTSCMNSMPEATSPMRAARSPSVQGTKGREAPSVYTAT